MQHRHETEEEHRRRDEQTWGNLVLLSYLFPGLRWIWLPLCLAVGGIWFLNVLGESGVANDPDIVYVGKDPRTGQIVASKGCRPERRLPDGTCDKTISMDTVRKAFPHWGSARQVPLKN